MAPHDNQHDNQTDDTGPSTPTDPSLFSVPTSPSSPGSEDGGAHNPHQSAPPNADSGASPNNKVASSRPTGNGPAGNGPTIKSPTSKSTTGNAQTTAGSAPAKQLFGLTNPGSDYPAATEAIKYLIQAVGRDVGSFRRNTHVSYMVVERARDLVNGINRYIEKVESSTEGDWESFIKFTAAIEPLEE